MCGRYALALRPSQVRSLLQDENMPVYDAPEDEGDGAPRQSYNFAPGYHGIVYRADVPDWGAGPAREHGAGNGSGAKESAAAKKNKKTGNAPEGGEYVEEQHLLPTSTAEAESIQSHDNNNPQASETTATEPRYKLQSMKWGLIPFWTKRNPDYGAMLKTINCRDDSLATPGGMWSTMKARKRCIVVAQGFYEWLKPGGPGGSSKSKDKIPHYIKRKDGKLLCLAGLWDCVVYDDHGDKAGGEGQQDQKNYTYTIITTDSNKQLKFLHDRMPIILDPGSEAIRTWLDPKRHEWSKELQGLLKPYAGELEVYPVNKEVGKVGNNSPSFIIPVASRENKHNIANFFAALGTTGKKGGAGAKEGEDVEVKREVRGGDEKTIKTEMDSIDGLQKTVDNGGMFTPSPKKGLKRERTASPIPSPAVTVKEEEGMTPKKRKVAANSVESTSPTQGVKGQRPTISATKNQPKKTPTKNKGGKAAGSQKITKFFGNSA